MAASVLRIDMNTIRDTRCKLCLAEAKLCKSHIIPEFCFKELYDENHRFIDLYDVRNEKHRLGQKGYSEPLLCSDCEERFARYERHCRRVFSDPLPSPRVGAKRFFDLPNVDWFKLRYFLLSILWRASVAKCTVFTHVNLGHRHGEILRKHLLAETLPPFDQYGCLVLALHYEDEPMKDIIVEPTYCRIEGHKAYRFVVAGLVFFCVVSSHPVSEHWHKLLLGYSDQVTVYRTDLPDLRFMRDVWNGL